jgi:hypothetical protein
MDFSDRATSRFILSEYLRGISIRTALNYLFGAKANLQLQGFLTPPINRLNFPMTMFFTKHLAKNRLRAPAAPPRRLPRLGFDPTTLAQVGGAMLHWSDATEALSARAVAYALFFGHFRPGELLSKLIDGCVSAYGPRFRNVSFFPEGSDLSTCTGITFHLASRKNDHVSADIPVAVPRVPILSGIDPISAISDAALDISHINSEDAVFPDCSHAPLSYTQFRHILAFAVKRCGLDPHRYLPHSFRIGAATTGASLGFPDYIIRALGQWNSDCYNRYIRLSVDQRLSFARSLATANKSQWAAASIRTDALEQARSPADFE